ncbi:MAG: DUF72 domain-containing protein [Candidatus Bathyarchaeaceae archaeon]
MVKIRVGTSGYSYFWNEGVPSPFQWYCKQGFNTVEINVSFYRFPVRSWIKTWIKCPSDFDFSIKVHRAITHYQRLKPNAIKTWLKFKSLLKEMEDKISFWLFQMPPDFAATSENMTRLSKFFPELNLGNSAVIEFRHASWWNQKSVCKDVGATFCSVDAPDLPREIVSMNDALYVRLHGRETWYGYVYSERELEEMIEAIKKLDASKKYIYLNNNHGMLPNGKFIMLHV